MAHVEKYQRSAVGAMMHHYRRDREATLERDNVNRARTNLNYEFGQNRGIEFIQERIKDIESTMTRSVRSDAIVMCDWIVTAPPDLRAEDQERFFAATYQFLNHRYGEQNMLGGWVHMDESKPHIHASFMPVVERENGKLALSAKEVLSRQELRRFHNDLSDHIERALGYRTQIKLDEDNKIGRALSRLDGLETYQAAKDEIRATDERLERLRRDEQSARERNSGLEAQAQELRDALRKEELREQQIEEAYRAREAQAKGLSRQVEQAREKMRELTNYFGRLRDIAKEHIDHIRAFFGHGNMQELARQIVYVDQLREQYTATERDAVSQKIVYAIELKEKLDAAEVVLERAQNKFEKANSNLERAQNKLDELMQHKLRNRAMIPAAKIDLIRAQEQYDVLVRERDQAQEKFDEVKKEYNRQNRLLRNARISELRDEIDHEHKKIVDRLRTFNDRDRSALAREMQKLGGECPEYRMAFGQLHHEREIEAEKRAHEQALESRDVHGIYFKDDRYDDELYCELRELIEDVRGLEDEIVKRDEGEFLDALDLRVIERRVLNLEIDRYEPADTVRILNAAKHIGNRLGDKSTSIHNDLEIEPQRRSRSIGDHLNDIMRQQQRERALQRELEREMQRELERDDGWGRGR